MWAQMQAMRIAHGLPDDFVAPERSWDFVSWLPMAHDMGFVGQLLLAWSGGVNMMLRDPQAFLVNPLVWLQDLHDEKAMCSSSPNFALDLVMRKLERSPDHDWDLSNLARIWCGGEAPNPTTLRRFASMTARYGLRENVLAPAYGMAEVGACVSLSPHGSRWKVAHVELEALSKGRVVALDYLLDGHTAGSAPDGYIEVVSNGAPLPGYQVRTNEDNVLEVEGPSLYSGYLGKTSRNGAHTTGDMGALVCGEVVVVGRADDVIVLRGRNVYPQDVEESCAAFVRAGCVAAVTDGEGGVAIVAEAQTDELEAAADSIRKAVTSTCGVGPSSVVFVARGSLAKTSSGKTKRRGIARQLADGTLGSVATYSFR
jgi:fatty-acyl-CoA synthase